MMTQQADLDVRQQKLRVKFAQIKFKDATTQNYKNAECDGILDLDKRHWGGLA